MPAEFRIKYILDNGIDSEEEDENEVKQDIRIAYLQDTLKKMKILNEKETKNS